MRLPRRPGTTLQGIRNLRNVSGPRNRTRVIGEESRSLQGVAVANSVNLMTEQGGISYRKFKEGYHDPDTDDVWVM